MRAFTQWWNKINHGDELYHAISILHKQEVENAKATTPIPTFKATAEKVLTLLNNPPINPNSDDTAQALLSALQKNIDRHNDPASEFSAAWLHEEQIKKFSQSGDAKFARSEQKYFDIHHKNIREYELNLMLKSAKIEKNNSEKAKTTLFSGNTPKQVPINQDIALKYLTDRHTNEKLKHIKHFKTQLSARINNKSLKISQTERERIEVGIKNLKTREDVANLTNQLRWYENIGVDIKNKDVETYNEFARKIVKEYKNKTYSFDNLTAEEFQGELGTLIANFKNVVEESDKALKDASPKTGFPTPPAAKGLTNKNQLLAIVTQTELVQGKLSALSEKEGDILKLRSNPSNSNDSYTKAIEEKYLAEDTLRTEINKLAAMVKENKTQLQILKLHDEDAAIASLMNAISILDKNTVITKETDTDQLSVFNEVANKPWEALPDDATIMAKGKNKDELTMINTYQVYDPYAPPTYLREVIEDPLRDNDGNTLTPTYDDFKAAAAKFAQRHPELADQIKLITYPDPTNKDYKINELKFCDSRKYGREGTAALRQEIREILKSEIINRKDNNSKVITKDSNDSSNPGLVIGTTKDKEVISSADGKKNEGTERPTSPKPSNS